MTKEDLIEMLKPYSNDTIVCVYSGNNNPVEVDTILETQVAGNQIGRKTGLMDAIVLY